MRHFLPLLAGACLSALSSPATAFNRTTTTQGVPIIWQQSSMPVPYVINERGTPDVDGDAEFDAIRQAMGHWLGRCDVCLWIEYDGTDSSGPIFDDGKNTIGWLERRWPYAPEAIAITTNLIEDNGDIYETDMELNGRDFTWAILSAGECNQHQGNVVDVENIVTHEAGHFLGLGHSPIIESTMYAQATDGDCTKRTLHADDLDGLRAIYQCENACTDDDDSAPTGDDDDDDTTGKDSGGDDSGCSCSQVDSTPRADLMLGFVGVAWMLLNRRRRA